VFGSVRKPADANRLSSEIGASFTPLLFDVADEAAVLAVAREVRAALGGETLCGLVNNAGIVVAGTVLELRHASFRSVARVRSVAEGKPGRIVVISSVVGKNGNPLLSAYAASTFAIEGLSESLRREVMLFGIDVIIIIAPGVHLHRASGQRLLLQQSECRLGISCLLGAGARCAGPARRRPLHAGVDVVARQGVRAGQRETRTSSLIGIEAGESRYVRHSRRAWLLALPDSCRWHPSL
jgi:hypothetical protein